ncbi:unnamed protein product, partial [marine sediment metagenome]
MKALDFWKCICDDNEYRFFAGTPCLDLLPLYKSMNVKFMHYLPAVEEKTALGFANGVYFTEIKSAIIINLSRFYNILDEILNYNFERKVPILILAYKDTDIRPGFRLPFVELKDEKSIQSICNRIERRSIPGILSI